MAAPDVTFQDGLKHPYLLALVRWCVSSFWSTASVILHRLTAAPTPQIKGPKPTKTRPASYDHLHPEPRVDCEVLHAPEQHTLDVIFVHGLYGSLGNTWRQGEWQTKYDKQPNKVPLRRPHAVPTCRCTDEQTKYCSDNDNNVLAEETQDIRHNSNTTTHINAKLNNRDEISEKTHENNYKYRNSDSNNETEYCRDNKNDRILKVDAKNEVCDKSKFSCIERVDKIRQINARNETDFQKNGFSIANNDKASDNNLNTDKFIDRNIEYSNKIKDFEVKLPSSNFREIMRDINDQNENIKGLDGKANGSKSNTYLYDTIQDINKQIDNNNCYNENKINAKANTELYDNIQKILPKENLLITEKFYNNTLLDDVDIASYETQAQFVKDLFENSVKVKSDKSESKVKSDKGESESEVKASDCKCEVKCDPGCGCICDDCYSPCWPRDWIGVDYPGARVISINYTSDPYLWRPLWVKESKRLRLHERAEQMMSQLLDLGVGEKPIIWVGHSKGGLFIKKMYCEAYEAHLKLTKKIKTKEETRKQANEQNTTESKNDNEINHSRDKLTDEINETVHTDVNLNEISEELDETGIKVTGKLHIHIEKDQKSSNETTNVNLNEINNQVKETSIKVPVKNHIEKDQKSGNETTDVNLNESYETNDRINEIIEVNRDIDKQSDKMDEDVIYELNDRINNPVKRIDVNLNNFNEFNDRFSDIVTRDVVNSDVVVNSNSFDNLMNNRIEVVYNENDSNGNIPNSKTVDGENEENATPLKEAQWLRRARLWRNSAGFMFYSVPHRGSPLADIKTPITSRSIELMEICKDCPLVLSLQASWSAAAAAAATAAAAAAAAAPAVRSVVETRRTLMSVLYLRIVSVDSADPGIGSLNGVDVDHREICKPSSRQCLLYRELMTLMETALKTPRKEDW